MEVRMARDVAEGIPSVASPDSMERMRDFPGGFLEGFGAAVPREDTQGDYYEEQAGEEIPEDLQPVKEERE
ncbi:hypothetical protein AAC387_Pa06g0925 [Persea americana]